ncbi:MAG TPA: SpoIIE family protein phosphatase [Streptosporangiaceae bacterium]|nr:SpoIIE family protein phosphatase [Streptosporangiaceae bacterium]
MQSIAAGVDDPVAIACIQFSARSARGRPDGAGLGDFYEVLPLAAGRWGVAVGEVRPGPGPDAAAAPAASGTGSLTVARAVLRATALIEQQPSRVLAALNRALLASAEPDRRSVAATYAVVRPSRARTWVRVSAAGQHTVYVRRGDGTVSAHVRQGAPLGLRADPQLRDTRLLLRAGDSLIMVTESVTAALASAGYPSSGDDRLRYILAGLGGASAARAADTIVRAVRDCHGGRPDQEVVALVLKVPSRRRGSGTHSGGWTGTRRYSSSLSCPSGGPVTRRAPARRAAAESREWLHLRRAQIRPSRFAHAAAHSQFCGR